MQNKIDLISEKEILGQNQDIAMEHSCFHFGAIISNNNESDFLHSQPISSFAENSNGVKHPCSTLITLLLNFFFFHSRSNLNIVGNLA